jgi:sigma-54 specific flagellar transcriptional regulator A
MSVSHVLIIDQDTGRRAYVREVAAFMGCETITLADDAAALPDDLDPASVTVALVGQPESGEALLRSVQRLSGVDEHLPIFVFGGRSGHESLGPEAARIVLGWLEFPLRFPQLTNAFDRAQVARESARAAGRPIELFRSLVGNSRSIDAVRRLIEQVADSDASVLILGESGTGKEVVARTIHYRSSRRDRPFVPVNCGAIRGDLLDGELFGQADGSFDGANVPREGRFGLAEGGTLFLDEIGDMSAPMQVKLLRVLQDRTFERVGSTKTITADVRIIAATHRDLEQEVERGGFRQDLYYRLNVFPIEMPPLRERTEDIPLLIGELIKRIEHEKRGSVRLTPPAVLALCEYPWPGNVRELANLIERLAIMFPYRIVDMPDLPAKFRLSSAATETALHGGATFVPMDWMSAPRLPRGGLDLKHYISNLEYSLIRQALDEADGVVAHAARLLKMRRTTLVEKLRKYGHRPQDRAGAADTVRRAPLNS